MDGLKFFLFFLFLVGCMASVIPNQAVTPEENTQQSNPEGNAEKSNQATNIEISNIEPPQPMRNAEITNAAVNGDISNPAQSNKGPIQATKTERDATLGTPNLSPETPSGAPSTKTNIPKATKPAAATTSSMNDAPPGGETPVINNDKKATAKTSSAITTKKQSKQSRINRILTRLLRESLQRLEKLILSKKSKSKTLRKLALRAYVEKAKKEGQTSEAIKGDTALDQFQMDKFLKLKTESVTKLIYGVSKFPERMRKNALKVYLILNLPSKSDLVAEENTDTNTIQASTVISNVKGTTDKDAMVTSVPDNVKVGEHELQPTENKVATMSENVIAEGKKKKKETKDSTPSHVKVGDNVAHWSLENENSEFPMQTHAKPDPLGLSHLTPDKISSNNDVHVQPTLNEATTMTENVNTDGEKKKKEKKDSTPSHVKVGDNVAQWSLENENSEFPMQTHAKPDPLDLSVLTPDKISPSSNNVEVQPAVNEAATMTENVNAEGGNKKKEKKDSTPSHVKVGDNVAQWSLENENSEFPMQTHAKPDPLDLSVLTPDKISPSSNNVEVQPAVNEAATMTENVNAEVKEKTKEKKDSKPSDVKVGDNVAQWSQENENSEFPMQTHAKPLPLDLSNPAPDTIFPTNNDVKVQSAVNEAATMTQNVNAEGRNKKKEKKNSTPSHVKVGDNVAQWSLENENSEFPMQTHAKSFDHSLPKPKPSIKKDSGVQPIVSGTETLTLSSDLPIEPSENTQPASSSSTARDVKVGENVAAWSQENENSDSPMQTHAKPDPPVLLASLTSNLAETLRQPSRSNSENNVHSGHTSKVSNEILQTSKGGIDGTVQSTSSDSNVKSIPNSTTGEHGATEKSFVGQASDGSQTAGQTVDHEPESVGSISNTADLNRPFSAPNEELPIPAAAFATLDSQGPIESSSFTKTSQVLSTGDHVTGTSSGGVLSDKDISAVISSFFYDPDSRSQDKLQSPRGTSAFVKDREHNLDNRRGMDNQAFIMQQIPASSMLLGPIDNDRVNNPHWRRTQQHFRTNINNFDQPLIDHISGMRSTNPLMPVGIRDLNIEQVPDERNRDILLAFSSFPNSVARARGSVRNPSFQQPVRTSGSQNRGFASPSGVVQTLGRTPISGTLMNANLQRGVIPKSRPELVASFTRAQPILPVQQQGGFRTVYNMDPLQTSTFIQQPNVRSTIGNVHRNRPQNRAFVSNREIAQIISSFFL